MKEEPAMAYEVPPLPYDYDALEPHIDEATMKVHHDKHHQAYVDKANAALEGTEWDGKPIEDVLKDLDSLPSDKQGPVRNNGGGHYNHSLFWESMSPDGGGEPSGALGDAINSAFGSFDDFKTKLKETGVGQFGSGWAWLVHDGSGLAIVGTPNQDSPLSKGQTPLVGVDVWEHAYYLKYQNKRGSTRSTGARSPSATRPWPERCGAACADLAGVVPGRRGSRGGLARPGVDLRGRAPAARERAWRGVRRARRHRRAGGRLRALAGAVGACGPGTAALECHRSAVVPAGGVGSV
jgi:Fe-Mn family superoxide dismutase